MITCNLKGGLGNMMFQVAAMKSLAKDNGTDAYFHNLRQNISDLNTLDRSPSKGYANNYLSAFKNFGFGDNLQYGFVPSQIIPVGFGYDQLTFVDNACYDGFFQSEKFFLHNRQYILDIFRFSDEINDMAKAIYSHHAGDCLTCAIHVRRGDYLLYPNVHPVQSIGYYTSAMVEINAEKYLVFSDDMEWCRANFKGDRFVFIDGNLDYIDMALMHMCDYQIICNSSFSWWGAWLNDKSFKKVVGPSKWFGTAAIDSSHILPDSWIKI